MPSPTRQPDGRWMARFRDPAGRQRQKVFPLRKDAQRWLDEVTADVLTGRYVDARAEKVTFKSFSTDWLASRTSDPITRINLESRLRLHLVPTFGPMQLRLIRPSHVQAWLAGQAQTSAPRTTRTLLSTLSAILTAAVDDGLIPSNPCSAGSVRPPALDKGKVEPWNQTMVAAVRTALPQRYEALALVAAGLGLRQGELLGLRVEDVDFLRHRVRVRQQVKQLHGRLIFAPPKGGREREVPLPQLVADELAAHLSRYPAEEVTLPWRDLTGPPRTGRLIWTTRERKAVNKNYLNPMVWKPALAAAGITTTRENGMHALRHFYASATLAGGVSIRALADYLGHADPGFTLRVYSHLMPDDEKRTRSVMDAALSAPAEDQQRSAGAELD